MKPFVPHALLPLGHAMTIAGALLRPRAKIPSATERIFEIDRETRVLALCSWQPNRERAPTIVALHGLTGSAEAGYLRGLAAKAMLLGFNVVRLNTRNCGGTEHLTPTLYHSGLTTDCRTVIEKLRAEGIEAPFVVGFSMGGNVALKLACELGTDAPRMIGGVAAVSPPIFLAEASRAIDTGWWNAIYQRTFVRFLVGLVRKKAALFPDRYDLTGIDRINTLRAFDERYIAPMFGFAGADDYYERASAGPLLDALTVPALIISARDDSIIPIAPFEVWRARAPRSVSFLLTERGGHTGFIGRATPEEDRYWAENRILEWISSAASSQSSG